MGQDWMPNDAQASAALFLFVLATQGTGRSAILRQIQPHLKALHFGGFPGAGQVGASSNET
jgi:pantothenate kinase-related protein Tda10